MRTSEINRITKETKINLKLNLDGSGKYNIKTGIGFFDHMLEGFTKNAFIDLDLNVVGDLNVCNHHTVEDTGIALGSAINEAVSTKEGINRYGSINMVMDDAFIAIGLDFSGRGFYQMDYKFSVERLGDFETETVEEFLRALAMNAKINLHIMVLRGNNNHHIIEGIFKGVGRALGEAISYNPKVIGIPSTKGVL